MDFPVIVNREIIESSDHLDHLGHLDHLDHLDHRDHRDHLDQENETNQNLSNGAETTRRVPDNRRRWEPKSGAGEN